MNINPRIRKYKHKHYKRLRADLWGVIGLKNKKNRVTKKLKTYLEQDFKFRIRKYKKPKKTQAYLKTEKKTFFSRFFRKKKKRFYQKPEFNFDVVVKPFERRRKRQSYRGNLLTQRRRFLIFFGEQFLRKQLRKIMKVSVMKRNRFLERKYEINFPSQKSLGSTFGSRLDLLIFRSHFCTTMRQSRQLVMHNKVMVMERNDKLKFFKFKKIKKLDYSVPIFTPFKLQLNLQKKRKNFFRHLLLKNLVYYARPKDLFIDYVTFISFKLIDANNQKLPFGGNISYFAGLSKYF